ncbi:hypothetical protein [Clostridium chromiireducens]|uniref:Uncharacterized protein n=1 Tax=Clostridium chromiireducens TaxID=225345 RepID=A0A1V4I420_9CLOT|nr:hypothetical protein [Clostridium chromiireducens]OPJ54649.1 hypothetical protein CLCHR_48010 [Clostridium chromiireducens]
MASYYYYIKMDTLETKIKQILVQRIIPYNKAKIISIEEQYIEYLLNGFRGTDISFNKENKDGLYCYHVNKDSFTDAPVIEKRLTEKFFSTQIHQIINSEWECISLIQNNWPLEKKLKITEKNLNISKSNYKEFLDIFTKLKEEVMKTAGRTLIQHCKNDIEQTVKTQFNITNELGLEKIKEIKKHMVSITNVVENNISKLSNEEFRYNDENLDSAFIRNKIAVFIKEQEKMINELLIQYGYDRSKRTSFSDKLFAANSSDIGYYLDEYEQALVNLSNSKKQMNNLQEELEQLNIELDTQKAVALWEQA